MKQIYWEQFAKSGRVEDYLFYKGMETCQNVMEKHEETKSESANNSNGNDTFGVTHWRI